MLFSSGTSGLPKAVMLSHHNLIAQLLTMRSTNPFICNTHMSEVFFPPFAHIYGIVTGVLLPVWVGCHSVLMRTFDFIQYVKGCEQIHASVLRLVPATAVRLVKDPAIRAVDLGRVKSVFISGAALASETVKELGKMLHPEAEVLNGYGMSEATLTMTRETRPDKSSSVGRAAAGTQIRIVGEDGKDVAVGENGECWVKAPTVFMGYKGNKEETASSFQDGWFKTGDILQIDHDGFFWLTGRKKELIKYKGNQVPPAELEAVLLSHSAVAEAGVCGLWDEQGDTEVPAGCIVLTDVAKSLERQTLLQEMTTFFNTRVSVYKRLRGGLFVLEVLPKGTTGKLLRRELPASIKALQKVDRVVAKL
jgi:4-coumarate--CoA ligase